MVQPSQMVLLFSWPGCPALRLLGPCLRGGHWGGPGHGPGRGAEAKRCGDVLGPNKPGFCWEKPWKTHGKMGKLMDSGWILVGKTMNISCFHGKIMGKLGNSSINWCILMHFDVRSIKNRCYFDGRKHLLNRWENSSTWDLFNLQTMVLNHQTYIYIYTIDKYV